MSTHEERLKVAIEVLGDHAWVKTWVHHQGVAALLNALVARDERLCEATARWEDVLVLGESERDRANNAEARLADVLRRVREYVSKILADPAVERQVRAMIPEAFEGIEDAKRPETADG